MVFTTNTWYHFKIKFDCGTGGDGTNDWHLWIDNVEKSPSEGYDFKGSPLAMNNFEVQISWTSVCYIDAVGYSWDPGYDLGENYEPHHLVDADFELTLDELDLERLKLFESCEISYSINTNTTEQITVHIYNFISEEWIKFDTLNTDNSKQYNGYCIFYSTDYISSNYKVKVTFAKNGRVNAFKLNIYGLEAKYNWSSVLVDFNMNSEYLNVQLIQEMSSPYSTTFQGQYVFNSEGFYFLTFIVDDGNTISKKSILIEIIDGGFSGIIGGFPNETREDNIIQFTSGIYIPEGNTTLSDYKYFWSFGDGVYSTEKNPVHSYSESGVYNISLTTIDCFGNIFTDLRNITIVESPPEIVGPFTYYGIEGQEISLNVSVFEAFKDELDLEYEWIETSTPFSTDKIPSVVLHDGSYNYILNVTDNSGYTSTANISVAVEDAPPIALV